MLTVKDSPCVAPLSAGLFDNNPLGARVAKPSPDEYTDAVQASDVSPDDDTLPIPERDP